MDAEPAELENQNRDVASLWTKWRALVADLEQLALQRRWGRALMVVGWVHLGIFLACQVLDSKNVENPWPYLGLWALELLAVLVVMRRLAGRGWAYANPLMKVIARMAATFLILSFNLASLNTLMGRDLSNWFKPAWCTLSTFCFAMMAWLVNLWYLVPAVQMYFTSLLMLVFPGWSYLIYGLSWCLALQGVGLVLERRRNLVLKSSEFKALPDDLEQAEPPTARPLRSLFVPGRQ